CVSSADRSLRVQHAARTAAHREQNEQRSCHSPRQRMPLQEECCAPCHSRFRSRTNGGRRMSQPQKDNSVQDKNKSIPGGAPMQRKPVRLVALGCTVSPCERLPLGKVIFRSEA